jgi:hypothetical protein
MKHLPHILYWFWLTLTGREKLARRLAYRYWAALARAERLAASHSVVCSWCKTLMRPGNPRLGVSHGICPECYQRERASFQMLYPSHPLSLLPPEPPHYRNSARTFPARHI